MPSFCLWWQRVESALMPGVTQPAEVTSETNNLNNIWQDEVNLGAPAQRMVSGVVWLNQNKHLVAVILVKLVTFGPPALQHWQVDSLHLSQSNAVSLSTRRQRPCQQRHKQQSADPSRAEHKTSSCQ